jgi:DnaJ-class molecular chaperone
MNFNLLFSVKYHPDSNSADKSLHEKFVKINQAFSILGKQSTRITYDQCKTLNR